MPTNRIVTLQSDLSNAPNHPLKYFDRAEPLIPRTQRVRAGIAVELRVGEYIYVAVEVH